MNDRPLPPPLRATELIYEIPALLGLVFLAVWPAIHWSSLPETVPTHFGFDGEPDGWGDKRSIWILPGIALALYLMLTAAMRFPHRFNYLWPITPENAARQYAFARRLISLLKIEIVWTFAFLTWRMTEIARGDAARLGAAFLPVMLIALLATVTWYLIKAQSDA